MLVAICDDDKFFLEELRRILFAFKAERRLHIDVYLYESGEALLADKKAFDMVFLDYQMPGLNGMDVARQLRSRNLTCSIVFVTAYPQFVFESFEVQPYRFFCKPISPEIISNLMTGYIRNQKLLAPITVLTYDGQVVIPSKDILYVEGDGKYCIIRTKDETYHCSKTLAQVHALLPQHCFYRSHKSYVVNRYSISGYDGAIATLTNQENARIGRSKIPEFKRVYRQFVKDYYVKL